MAISKDAVFGLDLTWFGEPFVQAANNNIGSNLTLDICYLAEPFTVSYAIGGTPGPTFNATRMFALF